MAHRSPPGGSAAGHEGDDRLAHLPADELCCLLLQGAPDLPDEHHRPGIRVLLEEVKDLGEGLPMILVDRDGMLQVLLNIIRNAEEAMQSGGAIWIETSRDGNSLSIRISDTGHGMPEDEIAHLFEFFYTTKQRGTGLGLPICKAIVERFGGTIEVESEEGEGTTFTLRFPVPPS